jgi:tRNA U34 5-carboxymethylaminomethyl modifying enzyme MnmG/GidA
VDNLYLSLIRAKMTDVPGNILLRRLAKLQELLRQQPWSLNLYYTYKNCVTYELKEVRRSIRKGEKYSGYVRNSSSVGSKKNSRTQSPIPETFEWDSYEELDYFEFLSVGSFSSGTLEIIFPDET